MYSTMKNLFLSLFLLVYCVNHAISQVTDVEQTPTLIVTSKNNIQFMSVRNPDQVETLRRGLQEARSCDYLYSENTVFWIDAKEHKIQATYTNVSSKDRKTHDIISMNLKNPEGLACDWVNRKLYWVDAETDRIEVSEVDGKNRKVIVWEDLDEPRAIAVDPSRGYIYWTDWGYTPKIERAGLDGSHRSVLYKRDGIFFANGLTIDYEAEKLYYVDAQYNFIYRMNFDGTGRQVVLSGGLYSNDNSGQSSSLPSTAGQYPFAVTMFGDMIYWTDWSTNSIHSIAKNGSGKLYVIKDKLQSVHDIRAYSAHRQKPANNPCGNSNGGCSHLCLLAPFPPHYSCACPTGVKMGSDNRTCEEGPQNILLVVRRIELRMISLDTPDFTDMVLPMQDVVNAVAIDYDPVDGFVYWTHQHSISRAKLDGSEQQVIISDDFGQSDGLAIDWISRNLYWTDARRNYVAVSRLNGTSQRYIITDEVDEPRAIVLDPMAGQLYWSDWGNHSKIERTSLDGGDRYVFVNTSITWPNGTGTLQCRRLAIDYDLRILYWGEAELDKIECIGLDGKNRRVLLAQDVPHVFGFSLLDNYMYWTDWQNRKVERMHVADKSSRTLIIDELSDLHGIKAVSKTPIPGTNPCATNNGGCTHLCLYTPKGPKCQCPTGMEILPDMASCIEPDAFLLYIRDDIMSNDIWSFSMDTAQEIKTSIPFQQKISPELLDFSVHDSRVYWSDNEQKKIYRSFLNGTKVETVLGIGIGPHDFEGLAVDWLSGNIYWLEYPSARIEVLRIGTTSRKTIVWDGLDVPHSIALDPEKGYFYWSEWGLNGGIKRAEMDGSNVTNFIPKKLSGRSNSLNIDFKERRLYWVDIDDGVVKSANLDGTGVRTMITEPFSEKIYAVQLYNDYLYFSNSDSKTIKRANKTNGLNRTRVCVESILDMKVYHASRQPGISACSTNNGGCQHLCFSAPDSGHKCACPSHYTLKFDNKTCSPPTNFLLFSQKQSIKEISLDDSAENEVPAVLPIHDLGDAQSVDYDAIEGFVYWLDYKTNKILKAKQNGTEVNILHIDNKMNGTIVEGNRYVNIADSNVHILPRKLALSPKHSILFFTNVKNRDSTDRMSIVKAKYDGKILDVLYPRQLSGVSAIAVDNSIDRLYWIHDRKIERYDFNGKKRRQTIVPQLANPIGLAAANSQLYWIDMQDKNKGTIEKLEKGQTRIIQSRLDKLTTISAITTIESKELDDFPCYDGGGGCSHICINNADATTTCACPSHLKMVTNTECGEPPTCPPDRFTCEFVEDPKHLPCIPRDWVCDGNNDCHKATDEKNCQFCSSPDTFMCGSAKNSHEGDMQKIANGIFGVLDDYDISGVQCIRNKHKCDGTNDCYDGSDEANCVTCQQHQFKCNDGSGCISLAQTCDGTEDCHDGSDEKPKRHCAEKSENDNSTLILIGIGAFCAIAVFVLIVLFFRKCRNNQSQGQGRVILYNNGLELNVDIHPDRTSINRNSRSGQGAISNKGKGDSVFNIQINPSTQPVHVVPVQQSYVPMHGSRHQFANFPSYERPHIPGASSSGSSMKYGTSSLTKQYLPTLNPPPSPATDRSGAKSIADGFYSSDSQSARTGSCRCQGSHRHSSRRNYHHRMHPTTPCTSDTCDDYSYHSSASGDCRNPTGSKSGRPSSPPPPYCTHCCYMCHYQGCHSGHPSYHGYPFPPVSYHSSHSSRRYHGPHDPRGYNSGATSSSSSSHANGHHSEGSCGPQCYHRSSRHHHGSKHSSRAGSSSHKPPAYNVMSSDLNSDSDPFAPPPTPRSPYLSDCCNTHDEGDDDTAKNARRDNDKFINAVEEEPETTETAALIEDTTDKQKDGEISDVCSETALTEPTIVDARTSESEEAIGEETGLLTPRATSPSITEHSYHIFNPPPSPATDSS